MRPSQRNFRRRLRGAATLPRACTMRRPPSSPCSVRPPPPTDRAGAAQPNTTSAAHQDTEQELFHAPLATPVPRPWQAAAPAAASGGSAFRLRSSTHRKIGVLRQGRQHVQRLAGGRRRHLGAVLADERGPLLSVFAARPSFMVAALGASTGNQTSYQSERAKSVSARRAAGGARCRAACLRCRRAAAPTARCERSSPLLHEQRHRGRQHRSRRRREPSLVQAMLDSLRLPVKSPLARRMGKSSALTRFDTGRHSSQANMPVRASYSAPRG